MKKSVVILLASIFLLFLIFICALPIQLIFHGCLWWECAPERSFRVSDLELPTSLFPEGSIVNHVRPLSDEHETIDDGIQSIYWDSGDGNAGYEVFRYPTVKKARDKFEFNKNSLVNSETGDVWKQPNELRFSSTTADVIYIACGYWSKKQCAIVARYQEYIIFFSTIMDEKMSYSKLEKIAVYIDKQMSSRLYP
jgi:hypothetical protein